MHQGHSFLRALVLDTPSAHNVFPSIIAWLAPGHLGPSSKVPLQRGLTTLTKLVPWTCSLTSQNFFLSETILFILSPHWNLNSLRAVLVCLLHCCNITACYSVQQIMKNTFLNEWMNEVSWCDTEVPCLWVVFIFAAWLVISLSSASPRVSREIDLAGHYNSWPCQGDAAVGGGCAGDIVHGVSKGSFHSRSTTLHPHSI